MADISKIKTPGGTEYNIKDATARSDLSGKQATITASGVLIGDGSGGVTAKTLDTSSLSNDNDHVPTSGAVKSAITKLANPNLLGNWYFKNPVNQRGQSSYSNANTYTIDSWKLTSGSVSVGASGITLNGTLVQILAHSIGETVVCSALLSDGTMITPTYDDSTKTFTLTASNKTVVAVKLELGDTQTLCHNEGTEANPVWVLNEIPNYQQELAKCQMYFYRVRASGAWCGFGWAYGANSTSGTMYVNVPVPMARVPKPTQSGNLYISGNAITLGAYAGGMAGTLVSLSFTTSGLSGNSFYYVTNRDDASSYIDLSAEL